MMVLTPRFEGPTRAVARAGLLFCFLALLVVPAGSASVYGQDENDFWIFYFENDTFYRSDRSYTNGLKLMRSRTLHDESRPWWLPGRLTRLFGLDDCHVGEPGCWELSGGWGFGQNMYTPEDIRDPELIRDDRPYGGWLYIGRVVSFSREDLGEQQAAVHSFELQIGVTGEPSFAEEAQKFAHRYLSPSSPTPMGWRHQVPFEPGFNLTYVGRQRVLEKIRGEHRILDVIPEWSTSVGTLFNQGGGGVMLRLGPRIGEDLGSPKIEPVAPMVGRTSDWDLYFFGGVSARGVLRNTFLEGGLFRDAPQTVSPERVVADIEAGATFRYRRFGASFRWVRRTPEFKERRIYQEYGAVSVTLLY